MGVAVVACISAGSMATPASAALTDPHGARQWHLSKIQADEAWATTTGTGALVAVVDSGVDLSHPDLATNVVSYSDADMVEPDGECGGKPRTCSQDGALDEAGHGTHVA